MKLSVWLLLVLGVSLFAGNPIDTLKPKVDEVFIDFDRSDTPGYVLGIMRAGEILYAKGYGMADLDHNIPMSSKTVFHIASLSKQFTAAAIALLVLDKKINLSDPVADYIPEIARFGADIRIKHLIYMTSGLPEYYSLPRDSGLPWHSYYYFTVEEAIETVLRKGVQRFKPGEKWAYSNINYMLLTVIVEKVSGKRFSAFMEKRVFEVLDMDHSQINDDSTLIVSNRASAYAARSTALARDAKRDFGLSIRPGSGWSRTYRNAPHYGGSGVMTSIEDLAKWDAQFYTGKLGEGFAVLMHRTEQFGHDKTNDGFGLYRGSFKGHEFWAYDGGDLDVSSYMARFPKSRLTVVCLANMASGNASARARKVLSILHDSNLFESP